MAEPLKHFFDARVVDGIADSLEAVVPDFDRGRFVGAALDGLEALELTERAWHIAEAMRVELPDDFEAAAELLLASLGPVNDDPERWPMDAFGYMPHVFLVKKYGLDHFEAAMAVQHQLTRRFSCEFSIRAYLREHTEATLARLTEWASDPDAHVRRLVSEGTRPRLPWAGRLRIFQRDPAPVLALLERLKDDPVRYVQRSVANNLNDIAKDHPDRVVSMCARWLEGATPTRTWIVGHALRSLVKNAHPGALELLGYGGQPAIEVCDVELSSDPVALGDKLRFSLALVSTSDAVQPLLVDYVVHFVKAGGETRPKVFKLKRLELEPGARATLRATVSFAPMTTRTAYPGTHRLELLVNGVAFGLTDFEVTA